jgi:hypothetical protein
MCRSIERAILEKNPSTRLSHEPCFGVNTKEKRPSGWAAIHALVLGYMRRMIVEDQLDRSVRRISGVEVLEKANELARPMAILDTGMHLAGQHIDPGEQAQRTMALVFMVARKTCVRPRLRWQVRCDIASRWSREFATRRPNSRA